MSALIIPMMVEAFASGHVATDQRRVPVTAPNYKRALGNSILGSANTPGVDMTDEPLKEGVHLHFVLPDAFTHSSDNEHYPAVPSRYLVSRIWQDQREGKLKVRNFLVESDFLSQDKEAYGNSITIPVFGEPDQKPEWRYLGRSYPLDTKEEKGKAGGLTAEYLDELTAVGPGDIMFAAYYPECRSVFGFYDDLSDFSRTEEAGLNYMVIGYYSDKEKDPFGHAADEKQFAKILNDNGFSVLEQAEDCNRCVVYGATETIAWKGFQGEYCPVPAGRVDVTLGNTSVEAVSRALCRKTENQDGVSERMLNALQYELYGETDEPDGNFKIDDTIFAQTFARWDALEGKGRGARTRGRLNRELVWKQRQLGAVWELYVMLYEDQIQLCSAGRPGEGEERSGSYPSREELLKKLEALCGEIEKIKARSALAQKQEEAEEDVSVQEQAFYTPKDPVVLLSGPGMRRSFAFGEDGRFTKDGTLLCQIRPIESNPDKEKIFCECFVGGAAWDREKLLPEYEGLLCQTLLLCKELKTYVEKKLGAVTVRGILPSPIAINGDPFAWATLFMLWKTEYRSTYEGDADLKDWVYEYGDTNLTYKGGRPPEMLARHNFSGRVLLTPHAVRNFESVVKQYEKLFGEDEELDRLAGQIGDLPVLSQNLSGFGEAFSGFWQALQFPVMGIGEPEELTRRVAGNLGEERLSIWPEGRLLPLRGGYVKLTKLTLVNTFGQTQPLIDESYYNEGEVMFAQTVDCGREDYALLAPAFTAPVRLNSAFLCAGSAGRDSGGSPAFSPVSGILVPELLNRRLLAYTSQGQYLGMVKTVVRNGKKAARWLSAPGLPADYHKLEIENSGLEAFLENLFTMEGAFEDFLEWMERYLNQKQSRHQLFWGRPLVLAGLKVSLEFFGGPETSKRVEDFGREETCQAEKVRIPLRFGDVERVTDGVFGFFEGDNFARMYLPFGAEQMNKSQYLCTDEDISLACADGEKIYNVLMEPDSPIHLHTGLLPVKKLMLPEKDTKAAAGLDVAAEISPVLASPDRAGLPSIPEAGEEGYIWSYPVRDKYKFCKITSPINIFEEIVLMDGMIGKENKQSER